MSDTSPPPPLSVTALAGPAEELRTFTIVVYALYIGAFFTGGLSGIAGVILAYIKRDEARGTVWESHFANAIQAFWVWFILFVIGVPTSLFFVGFIVIGAAFVYFLYRTVKGLLAALESRPYV